MRFINDRHEIPDRLFQAHEDGSVVFLCGAGVSNPAARALFGMLVELTFGRIGETVKWLKVWLQASGVQEGSIFRRPHGQGAIRDRLHADVIAAIFKRVARWIGMSKEQVDQVSRHSVRVGATQDLISLGMGLAAIMQAGRRRSMRMPPRYGEDIQAAKAQWLEPNCPEIDNVVECLFE